VAGGRSPAAEARFVRRHKNLGIGASLYPQSYFSLIPPFPRRSRVFVAMSFEPRFGDRWQAVLAPAIRGVSHGGAPLEPFRVDLSRASDAILTEILEAIADSYAIVADLTAIGEIDGRPVRNANVLYEVGLAHAVRLPEEVVLFRSDKGALDFDVAGVRVHSYDPDHDPSAARALVADTVTASLAALESRRRASLRAAAERLTLPAVLVLLEAGQGHPVRHPEHKTVFQAIEGIQRSAAITLLLELGAIRAKLLHLTPELLTQRGDDPSVRLLDYFLTPFGRALMGHLAGEMGALDPQMKILVEGLIAERPPEGAA
jgi:hypothetical protein